MTAAYIAHVTKHNGSVVRVDTVVENGQRLPLVADCRVRAALMAMLQVGEASRRACARPVDHQTLTTDCRVSTTVPVRKSQFGELLA